MEGVFLLLVFFFYIAIRLLFWLRPDARRRDRRLLAAPLALVAQRRFAEALPAFDGFLKTHPRSVEGLLARARCHYEAGEDLLAIADCCRATNADSYLPQAYMIKGKAFYRMGHLDEALTEFNKAAWYDRESPEPLTWRGLTFRRMGRPTSATADLLTAQQMGDENAGYYLRQGEQLGMEG